MSEIKLKSCPFCSGELEYSFLLGASECKGCGVMIGFPKLTRHEDKIIATNTRKPMSNIVEKLEYEKERHEKDRKYWSDKSWKDSCVYNEYDMADRTIDCYDDAINIVKQESEQIDKKF